MRVHHCHLQSQVMTIAICIFGSRALGFTHSLSRRSGGSGAWRGVGRGGSVSARVARAEGRPPARTSASFSKAKQSGVCFAGAMGISGLLPALRQHSRRVHVSEYRGRRVAVDTSCWLHRAAYSCALQLLEGRDARWFHEQAHGRQGPCSGAPPYVAYVLRRVQMLRASGVEPVLVFDGRAHPLKRATCEKRRAAKARAEAEAREALARGDRFRAEELAQRCMVPRGAMAFELMTYLRKGAGCGAGGGDGRPVAFVVAPYEADAQLCHLARRGERGEPDGVAALITEDSDLLVYGAPCDVLFKLDEMGAGECINIQQVLAAVPEWRLAQQDGRLSRGASEAGGSGRSTPTFGGSACGSGRATPTADLEGGAPQASQQHNSQESASASGGKQAPCMMFYGWSQAQFRAMCILSGCDFVDSPPGYGLKRAHNLVAKFKTLERALAKLQSDAQTKRAPLPPGFCQRVRVAEAAFAHMHVWRSHERRVAPLGDVEAELQGRLDEERRALHDRRASTGSAEGNEPTPTRPTRAHQDAPPAPSPGGFLASVAAAEGVGAGTPRAPAAVAASGGNGIGGASGGATCSGEVQWHMALGYALDSDTLESGIPGHLAGGIVSGRLHPESGKAVDPVWVPWSSQASRDRGQRTLSFPSSAGRGMFGTACLPPRASGGGGGKASPPAPKAGHAALALSGSGMLDLRGPKASPFAAAVAETPRGPKTASITTAPSTAPPHGPQRRSAGGALLRLRAPSKDDRPGKGGTTTAKRRRRSA